MKKIDLNLKSDIFLLWNNEYRYKYKNEDKQYYLNNIIKLNIENDNTSILLDIFTKILKKQNNIVSIKNEDIFWLFHYFNSVFL